LQHVGAQVLEHFIDHVLKLQLNELLDALIAMKRSQVLIQKLNFVLQVLEDQEFELIGKSDHVSFSILFLTNTALVFLLYNAL